MRSLRGLALVIGSSFLLAHCSSSSSGTASTSDGGPGSSDGGPVASSCAAPTGPGVQHHDTISADETWKAADGPHTLTASIKVAAGATLTIEPCAEVRIQKGNSLVVEGNLVALGLAGSPITIHADDAASPWGYLQVFSPGTMKLAHATVDGGGGDTTNALGMIEARGDQLLPSQEILRLDNVLVSNSASYGVSLRSGGALTKDSQAVTITKSKQAPMRIIPRLATNIPTGTYTGNTDDSIVVATEAYGEVNYEDVTYHDRGVPYRVGEFYTAGDFKVGPKHFTLTLEAGVKMLFKKAGSLRADYSSTSTGVIVANGAAGNPVVFTSGEAAPAAGDWRGIEFGTFADPGFKLDHVEIRFAGGPSQASGHSCEANPTVAGAQSKNDDAALAIYHQPGASYLTNSLIADSAGDGVDNAYTGTFVDAKPTNTFTNIATCSVSFPLPTMGLCPNMGCP